MTEDQLQAKCFQLTWNHFPEFRRCFWAVPNGGHRDPITAKKLQATGVIPGVWDIHIFCREKFCIVEFKVGNNVLSQPQREFLATMKEHGLRYFVVCYSVLQWKEFWWKEVLGRGYAEGNVEWRNWRDAK